LKEAGEHARREDGGIAVVIARRPCHMAYKDVRKGFAVKVEVNAEDCNGCKTCLTRFECPAIAFDEAAKKARINRLLCLDCGFCLNVCPKGAIREAAEK
jgi:indolepyruvate ferredoxin oxidoreductase alpha subunit